MCVDAEPPCIISVRVQLMLYMFIKLVCETHSSVHLYLIRNRPLKLQPNLRRISLRSVSRQHRCQRIYQAFRLKVQPNLRPRRPQLRHQHPQQKQRVHGIARSRLQWHLFIQLVEQQHVFQHPLLIISAAVTPILQEQACQVGLAIDVWRTQRTS